MPKDRKKSKVWDIPIRDEMIIVQIDDKEIQGFEVKR
jgi:hypothetical protein